MNKDWLVGHYTKLLGGKIEIIEHDEGPTWNDGGSWYSTILKKDGVLYKVDTPSNYNSSKYSLTKYKTIMKEVYVPA